MSSIKSYYACIVSQHFVYIDKKTKRGMRLRLVANLIELTQLDVLGFDESYRRLTIAMIMVLLIYFICKPLIKRLIKKQHSIFLTYVITSLLITILSLCIVIIDNRLENIAASLQAIALFGFFLVVSLLYQLIRRFIRRKLLKRARNT